MQFNHGMRSRIVSVTPSMATEWLAANNVNNRRVIKNGVEKLASAMLNGEFVLNGEAIKFSKSGRLIDGQHRLMAIVKSGMTIKLMIVDGLEEDAFKTIDTGRNRRGTDVLSIRGAANCNNLAGIYRLLNCHLLGVAGIESPISNSRVAELHERFPDASAAASLAYKFNKIGSVVVPTGYWFIGSIAHGTFLDEFFEAVSTGANLDQGNPALVLRNSMIALKGRHGGGAKMRNQIAAFTIKAANAWLDEKSIGLLRYSVGSEWPRLKDDTLFGTEKRK